jgi:hypothetical protein
LPWELPVPNPPTPIDKTDGEQAVDDIRQQLGIDPRLNIAYAEVAVGPVIDEPIGVSGVRSPPGTVPTSITRLFDTFDTPPGHYRGNDAEAKLLEAVAAQLQPDAVKGGSYPAHQGSVRLYSHFTICPSCDGVVAAFRVMFPNVELVVSHG